MQHKDIGLSLSRKKMIIWHWKLVEIHCNSGAETDNLFINYHSSFPPRYSCICAAGWNGFNCTDDIDECESIPCMNNATCLDILNGFLCLCLDGFTGKFGNRPLSYCGIRSV